MTQKIIRWVFAFTVAAIIGLAFAWAGTINTPTPIDYRIQLPTLEMP